MESHNTNPLETLVASVSKKKKKTLSTSRLSPNSKRKEKPRKRKKNKRRKERRKERKERRTVERSSRGASSRRGESRESIGMRGNFKSPSLFSSSSRKRTETFERGCAVIWQNSRHDEAHLNEKFSSLHFDGGLIDGIHCSIFAMDETHEGEDTRWRNGHLSSYICIIVYTVNAKWRASQEF